MHWLVSHCYLRLEATAQTSCCATSLPLRGPEVLSNGTTSITGLAPWKLFTLSWFHHRELPPPVPFPAESLAVTQPLRGGNACLLRRLNGYKPNKPCYLVSQVTWRQTKKQTGGCLSMHVVTQCNTDFKLEKACLYYFNINRACEAWALACGATVTSNNVSAVRVIDIVYKSSIYPCLNCWNYLTTHRVAYKFDITLASGFLKLLRLSSKLHTYLNTYYG